MARTKKASKTKRTFSTLVDVDESSPIYDGSDNKYTVDPRIDSTDELVIAAVESVPFVGRAISDFFFGETKRNEKLDQLAAQKVDVRRAELDRVSPQAARNLGTAFYDNAFARERSRIENVK